MYDKSGRELLEIDERLFSAKQSVDSLHQEIAEFFYCERADFTSEIVYGEEFASHLTDFYPTLVRRELGDQIGSMVRPSDRSWFKASASGKDVSRDQGAREFLEFMTEVNWSVLYSRDSGFRRAAKEGEHDFATFGMNWTQVSYNRNRDNLNFRTHHPKNCAGQEGPDGRVNHVHRKCDMTARAMAHRFGEDKLPQSARDALTRKDVSQKFKVRHVVIPLDIYDPYRRFPKGARWADVYVTEDGKILKEAPAFTFDYIVPRWQTVSGHFYAFSPATIIALPQARMIQRMMMTLIEAGEKQVDPPLVATEDVVTSPIDITAGAITYIDSEYDERLGQALRPLELGKNVGLGADLLADARALLADAFYINKLQPIASAQRSKTAYETAQLVQEYIRNALPLFEPIEDEWTGAVLDLVTQKVMRAGGYGPGMMLDDGNVIPREMPKTLYGQNITYEFNNSLKEARDRQVVHGFMESSNMIQAAAAVDPGSLAEVNTREMLRDAFGSIPGTRADWLVDPKTAEAARAKMTENAAAQEAMADVADSAVIAKQAGDAMQSMESAVNG